MVRGLPETEQIKVALVMGGHPYDVPGLKAMFERMSELDVYVHDLDNWAVSRVAEEYDVLLFYNMHAWGVLSVREDMDERILEALEQLGEAEQGIFVWHHALLAFPDSQVWSDVCNLGDRASHGFAPMGTDLHTEIGEDHPLTQGLHSWDMPAELFGLSPPGEESVPILTTEHPTSVNPIAWAHEYKNARVFCYQSGHDDSVYTNPNFQAVFSRAMRWLAGRI